MNISLNALSAAGFGKEFARRTAWPAPPRRAGARRIFSLVLAFARTPWPLENPYVRLTKFLAAHPQQWGYTAQACVIISSYVQANCRRYEWRSG